MVKTNPDKIVPLSISAMEIICILGQSHRIVGTSQYMKGHVITFPLLGRLPNLGHAYTPNLEMLVALRPELIVTWITNPGPELENQLRPFGIDVLRLNLSRSDRLIQETKQLAKIFDEKAQKRALQYEAFCLKHETLIKDRIKSRKFKPTLVIEQTFKDRVAGSAAGVSILAKILDAENYGDVFKNENAVWVDPEWVARMNPQYIVGVFAWRRNESENERLEMANKTRDGIMARPGWSDIPAVKNGHIWIIDVDLAGGARYILGLYQMAHFLYPEIVAQDEWRTVEAEYFATFLDDIN
ncbi:MAG: ABC transporter substrate-binding protein [Deltaproteobacteria bacterium]|nr:ABC transporter substrate-binding protein [Deltaproteobacteria bacterium]